MRYKTLCVDFESGSSSVMYEGDSQIQAILAAEDLNEQRDAVYAEELSNDDPSLTDEDIEDIIRDDGSFALVGLVFDMEDAKVVYWESKDTSDFCEPVPAGPLAAQLFGVDEDVAESANCEITSLEEAKTKFFEEAKQSKGATCPCCERYGKLYRRKLNTGMALSLLWMYSNGMSFVDVPKVAPREVLRSREFGKLAHWGLVEQQPNLDDPSKKHTGIWRITFKGIQFVEGKIRVPSHVCLYDNDVRGFEGLTIGISEALERPFHYSELMES